ncbi:4Fe-4S dicluster domain-containing protein [Thermodesulforhabdus norvegica]|uniref:2-oxoglutarate ferredoxin oxidoreductase subunit delta n=1 Tax=Thermodesulforhabdus norvegica TaxID=39841 RepID=A0A1I4R4L7_9BACT|nr:ferredoxin family protein [Thermodesulforhabdus norvegica]SFM46873.1 2-oxoglutarate ferredoxin oxidoreductase subunit delta [Thermodesulforhabdus norvegica]
MARVVIIKESCKGVEDCGICVYICPKSLFGPSGEMNSLGYIPPRLSNEEECTACRSCMYMCPDFAIVVDANSMTNTEEGDDE